MVFITFFFFFSSLKQKNKKLIKCNDIILCGILVSIPCVCAVRNSVSLIALETESWQCCLFNSILLMYILNFARKSNLYCII